VSQKHAVLQSTDSILTQVSGMLTGHLGKFMGGARIGVDIPIGKNGDCYDRYLVRMEEMRQSVLIIKQCLEKLSWPGWTRPKDRSSEPDRRSSQIFRLAGPYAWIIRARKKRWRMGSHLRVLAPGELPVET
jgi:hypothetical protein